MIFIFIACLTLSLWLTQAVITLPIQLITSFHLPFWLSLTLGGIVLSWLIGD